MGKAEQPTSNQRATNNNKNEKNENNTKKISLREIKESFSEADIGSAEAPRTADTAGTVAADDNLKTEVQKRMEQIWQEQKAMPDRDRYVRQLQHDTEWVAYCQIANGLMGKDMLPYFIAFWLVQKEKTWKSYEDYKTHFCNWLKYQNEENVAKLSNQWRANQQRRKQDEQQRQAQAAEEAAWEQHRERSVPMPADVAARLATL